LLQLVLITYCNRKQSEENENMAQDLRLLLSRAARTTTRYFGDRAAELDLSVVQGQALLVLSERPGMNLGVLAEALSKDQASTSILVDKLMSLGLVLRETDPADRRRAQLYITTQAEPFVRHIEGARDDINRLVLDALGRERSNALEALLVELLGAIEGSEAAPHRGDGV
jgi:DNA-binding MarR family transcriptional regulator